MKVKVLYRFYREDGGVTVSPDEPDGEYTTLKRLVAEDGYILTDGEKRYYCIDTDDASRWSEVEDE